MIIDNENCNLELQGLILIIIIPWPEESTDLKN